MTTTAAARRLPRCSPARYHVEPDERRGGFWIVETESGRRIEWRPEYRQAAREAIAAMHQEQSNGTTH